MSSVDYCGVFPLIGDDVCLSIWLGEFKYIPYLSITRGRGSI